MKKIAKSLLRLFGIIALVTLLTVSIQLFTQGMWLWGLPSLDEVQSVSLSYPSVTDTVKEVSEPEDIELALKLTGFLKYDLFEKADTNDEPLISITYHRTDGTEQTVSANRTTVWWQGKAYALKEKDMFVNLTEGLFFLEDLQENETAKK
ncbi:MAG TPA: hypothetical protein H9691_06340 [Firmicutes bacterium]|nr:hypothetical protein [Bacillota bacterium]